MDAKIEDLLVSKEVVRLVWIITNSVLILYAVGLIIYNKWFHKELRFHKNTVKSSQRPSSGPYSETLISDK